MGKRKWSRSRRPAAVISQAETERLKEVLDKVAAENGNLNSRPEEGRGEAQDPP